ncbi:GNAT family N-acetyltransferase (plasmid) [Rhizobium lusitanum]|uniref:acyl-homoserine-lactone synthase n=1 Tax=Rhizobium lusitanum TaxID=293958 RepID=UPI00161C7EBF|nr:acyl-homoserine-lactone synthase [Rhizobium lusitanum]QND45953.1 GNAT family N-acetyltransferase [Rhizobium lusitanum]
MIRIFIGHSASNQDAMEKIWRFRHEQFVERLGWHALRREDGREIDQFDHQQALHLALIREGEVVGYSRLLPTAEPHLLSHVYPEIMHGGKWPCGPGIFEWTRCVVAEGDILINGLPAAHVLMTGVMEFCLAAGIASLIVETHPNLVNLLISTGWDVNTLAASSYLDNEVIVPIQATPSVSGLLRHHSLYSMQGSTLQLERGFQNPLRPDVPLSHLEFLHPGEARLAEETTKIPYAAA